MKMFLFAITLILYENPAKAQVYKYDDLGRVTEIRYTDSTITRYAYDPAGNRISQITTTPIVTSVPIIDSNVTKLVVYPNPTPGDIIVELELQHPDNITITCYSLDGKLLFQEQHKNIRTLIKPFRLTGKPTGIYNIIVTTSTGKKAWKIVKL